MKLDLEVCKAIAIRYGLPLQFVFKEFHLMDVLGQAAKFVSLRQDSFVFKGGTALNKIYIKSGQRFSEDADFDLIIKDASRNLLEFSKKLAGSLEGYKIVEFRKVRDTMQFYCGYETPLLGTDHVRIDIAPKKLFTAKSVESGTAISEFTHASVSGIKVYSIEDLTARKMNALATRAEGKDVYDMHVALPLCSIRIFRQAIKSMLKSEGSGETVTEFIDRARARLSGSAPKKMRNLTNPFIPTVYRPRNWEELKNDLLAKLAAI